MEDWPERLNIDSSDIMWELQFRHVVIEETLSFFSFVAGWIVCLLPSFNPTLDSQALQCIGSCCCTAAAERHGEV